MLDLQRANDKGDTIGAAFHEARIGLFTAQLAETNPILNEISDCMTAEGKAIEAGDEVATAHWSGLKEGANKRLQVCSSKYNALMKKMREDWDLRVQPQ